MSYPSWYAVHNRYGEQREAEQQVREARREAGLPPLDPKELRLRAFYFVLIFSLLVEPEVTHKDRLAGLIGSGWAITDKDYFGWLGEVQRRDWPLNPGVIAMPLNHADYVHPADFTATR